MAQGQHLAPGHVLHVVGQRLELAAVPERDPVGVLLVAVHHVDHGPDLGQPVLDLVAVPFQPFAPAEPPGLVRVGQLDPHDEQVAGRAVEGEAAGIGAAVLHGLKHPGHLGAYVARPVTMDDARDTAHAAKTSCYGMMSRYSAMSQSETAAQNRSHSSVL